jgi:D-glycero-alpha-D-manno-heptose 1-phosphate guanylyltransferase
MRHEDKLKAVLLVGGLGTRLRSVVASTPKPLAAVGDRPFAELLVRQLRGQGIHRLLMCTGYLAQEVKKELADGSKWGITIEYSEESHPMGTAGAIKLAEPLLIDSSDFLVMNGDSFMDVDFQKLIQFHREKNGIASLVVAQIRNEQRYGTVEMTPEGRVIGFKEKTDADPTGFINAGIYVFDRKILSHIPSGTVSLERDIFPRILDQGVYALEQHGVFIDIGTPEDYARAQKLFGQLYEAVLRKQPRGGPA